MKGRFIGLLCSLAGVAAGLIVPSMLHGQIEISREQLVNALRILNTEEYSYRDQTGKFAPRDEMLVFLRKKGVTSQSPIDLENPQPYVLALTTSQDGAHYQVSLERPLERSDKSTWCKAAAFSDDKGVIFLGVAIGCEAAAP